MRTLNLTSPSMLRSLLLFLAVCEKDLDKSVHSVLLLGSLKVLGSHGQQQLYGCQLCKVVGVKPCLPG